MKLAVEHHSLANARARLLLVHGYAEHRRRYAELVSRLEARGIECHLFDLRGHGDSEGQRGHITKFDEYLDDLHRVSNEVPRGRPRFLFGHSLGGLIALSYLREHPDDFDGVIVSSPFLAPQFVVNAAKAAFAQVASRVVPMLPVASGLKPEWVSRDAQKVAEYRDDPQIFRTATPRWFTEVTAAQEELFAHADAITTPALFLLGGSDRIASHAHSMEVFARLGSRDKEQKVYAELFHEIFNELEREAVTDDLLAWLERRLPR